MIVCYLISVLLSWQLEFTAEQIEGKSDVCMHYVCTSKNVTFIYVSEYRHKKKKISKYILSTLISLFRVNVFLLKDV